MAAPVLVDKGNIQAPDGDDAGHIDCGRMAQVSIRMALVEVAEDSVAWERAGTRMWDDGAEGSEVGRWEAQEGGGGRQGEKCSGRARARDDTGLEE